MRQYELTSGDITRAANGKHTEAHYQARGQGMLDVMAAAVFTPIEPVISYLDGYLFDLNGSAQAIRSNPQFAQFAELSWTEQRERLFTAREANADAIRAARATIEAAKPPVPALPADVYIETPYRDEQFTNAIKRLGGQWEPTRRAWRVPGENAAKGQQRFAKYFTPERLAAHAAEVAAKTPAKPATPAPAPRPVPTVRITGNTYPVRDEIRALGGVWNDRERAWYVSDAAAEQARALVAAVPARVRAPRVERELKYGQLWQECEFGRCETEPVCVMCLYCVDHCTCQ